MSETGNGRKNWTRVVAAVGLVFLAVAGQREQSNK